MNTNVNNSERIYFLTFSFTIIAQINSYSLWGINLLYIALFWLFTLLLSSLVLINSLSKYDNHDKILIILLLGLTMIVGQLSDCFFELFILFSLIVGAKDIPFRKIVKTHFVITLCFCLINMIGSEMGLTDVPNLENAERESLLFGDFVIRKSYGYIFATDFANHVFFILLDYWLLKNGRLRMMEFLSYIVVACFVLVNTDTRLSFGCILLLLLSSVFVNHLIKHESRVGRLFCLFLVFSIPFLFFISLYATLSFDISNISWFVADEVLSHRLSLGNDAIQNYGIPLLGQTVFFNGWGTEGVDSSDYDYVDSSYVQYLIKWGIILMTLLIISFYNISKNAYKRKDYSLIIAISVAGIVGAISQFLFYLGYCVLLVALCASHPDYCSEASEEKDTNNFNNDEKETCNNRSQLSSTPVS